MRSLPHHYFIVCVHILFDGEGQQNCCITLILEMGEQSVPAGDLDDFSFDQKEFDTVSPVKFEFGGVSPTDSYTPDGVDGEEYQGRYISDINDTTITANASDDGSGWHGVGHTPSPPVSEKPSKTLPFRRPLSLSAMRSKANIGRTSSIVERPPSLPTVSVLEQKVVTLDAQVLEDTTVNQTSAKSWKIAQTMMTATRSLAGAFSRTEGYAAGFDRGTLPTSSDASPVSTKKQGPAATGREIPTTSSKQDTGSEKLTDDWVHKLEDQGKKTSRQDTGSEKLTDDWVHNLEDQGKKLECKASKQIQGWELQLAKSELKLNKLTSDIEIVRSSQIRLSQELELAMYEQKEIDKKLAPLEKRLSEQNPQSSETETTSDEPFVSIILSESDSMVYESGDTFGGPVEDEDDAMLDELKFAMDASVVSEEVEHVDETSSDSNTEATFERIQDNAQDALNTTMESVNLLETITDTHTTVDIAAEVVDIPALTLDIVVDKMVDSVICETIAATQTPADTALDWVVNATLNQVDTLVTAGKTVVGAPIAKLHTIVNEAVGLLQNTPRTQTSPGCSPPGHVPLGPSQSPLGPVKPQPGPTQSQLGPSQSPPEPAKSPLGPSQSPLGPTQSPPGPANSPHRTVSSSLGPVKPQPGPTQSPLGSVHSLLGPVKSQPGPTQSPLGSVHSPLGPVKSQPGPTQSPLGSVHSPLGPAKSPLVPAESPLGSVQSPLRPVKSQPGRAQSQLGPAQTPLGSVHSTLGSAKSNVEPSHSPLGSAHSPLGPVKSPLGSAQSPLGSANSQSGIAHSPIMSVSSTLGSVQSPLGTAHSPLGSAHSPLGTTQSPIGSAQSPLRTTHSPLGTMYSPLGLVHSPLGFAKSPQGSVRASSGSFHSPLGTALCPLEIEESPPETETLLSLKGSVHSPPIESVYSPLGSDHAHLVSIHSPTGRIKSPLGSVKSPLGSVKSPLGSIQSLDPVKSPLELQHSRSRHVTLGPVRSTTVGSNHTQQLKSEGLDSAHSPTLGSVISPYSPVKSRLSLESVPLPSIQSSNSQVQAHNSQLQTGDSQLEVVDSQLEAGDSQIEIVDSQLEAGDSQIEVVDSQLEAGDSHIQTGDSLEMFYPEAAHVESADSLARSDSIELVNELRTVDSLELIDAQAGGGPW